MSLHSASSTADLWYQVAEPPVVHTTCLSMYNQLLVIGGLDSNGKHTSAVYKYNQISDSWRVISHMTTRRSQCFAAVLPSNQLMVVGGLTGTVETDLVELATVQ